MTCVFFSTSKAYSHTHTRKIKWITTRKYIEFNDSQVKRNYFEVQ